MTVSTTIATLFCACCAPLRLAEFGLLVEAHPLMRRSLRKPGLVPLRLVEHVAVCPERAVDIAGAGDAQQRLALPVTGQEQGELLPIALQGLLRTLLVVDGGGRHQPALRDDMTPALWSRRPPVFQTRMFAISPRVSSFASRSLSISCSRALFPAA